MATRSAWTIPVGIISAKARGIDDSGLEFLQTDAAINPGNSGGPLFDLDGKVIGIARSSMSGGSGNVGLNFAIPMNTVRAVFGATPVNARDLHARLRRLAPGTRITLRALRDGERIDLPAVVGTTPMSPEVKR